MEASTETSTTKPVRGRKEQGQPKVIQLESLRTRVDDLVDLRAKAAAAADAYGEAVKATAEQAGLLASVVRKFVDARAGEKFEEAKTKAQQLSLCFEEIGEE